MTLLLLALLLASSPDVDAKRPNIVILLADDLGFSDLGCYGGEIETPRLDALARNGLVFTQFYNTARCWPTRAALLTGYYAQQVRRDKLPGIRSGHGGVRPSWAPLLSKRLSPLGYRSYHSGKWHLDGKPLSQGFHRSYWLRDHGRFFSPQTHFQDDQRLPAVERQSGYYATTAITDHALESLQDHEGNHDDSPFFLYVAWTTPHFPLHALPEDIDRYRNRYDVGWDVTRQQRWERMVKLGITTGPLSSVEQDVGPPYHFPEAFKVLGPGEMRFPRPWRELNEEQRDFQATKMAIHAAMVDRMDQEVGRLLDRLEAMGELENTAIFFLSDNGASAEIMVRDDGHDPTAPAGSAATHLCLGPGWSTVANTPFRRHKTWTHEGGIATPLIVHWPNGIEARGEKRTTPSHVIDLAPTIFEMASGQTMGVEEGGPPSPGKALTKAFDENVLIERSLLWWCHEGHQAIRVGDWKLVAEGANSKPCLFDLSTDRQETRDVAADHPDKVEELRQAWVDAWERFLVDAKRDLPDDG